MNHDHVYPRLSDFDVRPSTVVNLLLAIGVVFSLFTLVAVGISCLAECTTCVEYLPFLEIFNTTYWQTADVCGSISLVALIAHFLIRRREVRVLKNTHETTCRRLFARRNDHIPVELLDELMLCLRNDTNYRPITFWSVAVVIDAYAHRELPSPLSQFQKDVIDLFNWLRTTGAFIR